MKTEENRETRRNGTAYDLYVGYEYLYLCDEKNPEEVLLRFKQEMDNGLCISAVTLAELEFGMEYSSNPARNEQALIRFLVPLTVLPFDAAAATEYGKIRAYLQKKGTLIGALDMLIAAHARAEGLILVTNNVREFERVPELQIENWVG